MEVAVEIKDYLPKRIRDRVVRVDVDADFDYNKNRSIQHYFITLDDEAEFAVYSSFKQ